MPKVSATKTKLTQIDADAVVIGIVKGGCPTGYAADFDQAVDGTIQGLIEANEITGKPYELITFFAPQGMRARQVLLVGLGPRDDVDEAVAFRAGATASRASFANAGSFVRKRRPSPEKPDEGKEEASSRRSK